MKNNNTLQKPTWLQQHRAVLLLIVLVTCVRLLWIAVIDPTNDEAYHWLYTVYPAWSYFDHPPMVMWLQQLGLAVSGGWVHPFSLRWPFVLLSAGSLWALYRWTGFLFPSRAGYWAVVAYCLSGYFTAFGGNFILPDAPFLALAIITGWRVTVATLTGKLLDWVWVGLAFAAALASKYHAVLLPGGVVVYAVITPKYRWWLWGRGPWLAVLIGLCGLFPALYWNWQNEFISFKFQGSRATSTNVLPFLHEGPAKFFLGPVGYLLPWIWFWLVRAGWNALRHWRQQPPAVQVLLLQSLVPLGFFLLVSGLSKELLLHWPLIGFLPLYPLVGQAWVNWQQNRPRQFRFYIRGWSILLFVLAGFVVLQGRFGLISFPNNTKDPLIDLSGWRSVAEEFEQRGYLTEPNTIFATTVWFDSGQLAFALRDGQRVRCYHSFDARGFAFWSRPEADVGKTVYILCGDGSSAEALQAEYSPFFSRLVPLDDIVMSRHGKPFRTLRLLRGEVLIHPYQFANRPPMKTDAPPNP